MSKINEISVDNVVYEIEDKSAVHTEADPVFSASPAAGIKSTDIENWNNKSEFSGDYDDLTNKPDLSQFITNTVNNLTNYYLKSETYTKTEVNNLIGAIQQFHYEIVEELPQTGASNILYLVPKDDEQTSNVYDEYVYANSNWEKIGDTEIDLSDYVTTTDLNTALASYTTTADLTTLLAGKQNTIDSTHKLSSDLVDDTNATNKFVTSSEKTTWDGKQDALVSGTNIKTINSTSVLGSGDITTEQVQYSTMPTASATNLGQIVQYTGTTTTTAPIYTNGHFYVCVSDEQTTPTYSWEEISLGGGGSTPKAFIINYGDTSVSALAKYQEFLDDMLNGIFDTIVLKADGGGTNDYYICSFTNSNSARNIKLIGWSSGIQTLGTISAWRCIPISAKQVNIMWDANNTVYSVQYEDISKYSTEYIPFNYGRSVGAVLSVGNTNAFTPTSDYNPSTKKYTDDTALATVVADKLTGTSAPTTSTVGYVGQQYTDTTNNNQYVCTAVDTVTPEYTWVQVNGGGSVNTSETIINENGVVNAGTLFFNIDDLKLSGMSDTVKAKLTYLYNRIVAKEYIPQVFVYRTYNQVIAFLSGCSGNQTLYFTAFKQDSYSGNLMYNSCKVTLYITNGIVTGAASAFTDVSWNSLSRSGIDDIKTATGYDTTKTQVLKNVQGVLQWVDEA